MTDDQQLVRVLRALSEAHRFRMVQEVSTRGEISCGELGQRFGLSQPTVSHHLKILAEAGILKIRREGQLGMLTVNQELLDEVSRLLPQRLRTHPD